MRLTLTMFGLELDITFGLASSDEDDPGYALTGGTLTSERIEVGPTDRYMGFTNGREVEGGE